MMSTGSNPYTQGGQWNSPHPAYTSPAFGALPFSPTIASPSVVTFQFAPAYVGSAASPLNSTVMDSTASYFVITTTYGMMGQPVVTSFAAASTGTQFASIEWREPHPIVTIRNRVQGEDAARWLMRSGDRR